MGPEEYYGYQQQQQNNPLPSYDDGDQKRRIIIAGIGFFLLIFFGLIIRALLFSSPNLDPQITRIAASHQELARVARLGIESGRASSETSVAAANLRAIALTNLAEVRSYAATSPDFFPISGESLAIRTNQQTDARLEEAVLVNNYDATFEDVLRELVSQANTDMIDGYQDFNHLPNLQALLDTASSRYGTLLESF